MAISLDILKKIPPYQKGLFLLGVMVLIGVGYYFGMYSGKLTELNKLNAELVKKNKRHAQLKKVKEESIAFEEQFEALKKELKSLEAVIPEGSEIPAILSYITISVEKSHLDIPLFDPQKEKKKDGYIEVPFKINVNGDYYNFTKFLNEIVQSHRIIVIRNIQMNKKKSKGGAINLKITCTAVTFKVPKEKPPKKVKKKPKKKK